MKVRATIPPPPVRLVTVRLGIPGSAWSARCTMRACRSAAPPAPELTTISTLRSGFHSWATTAPLANAVKASERMMRCTQRDRDIDFLTFRNVGLMLLRLAAVVIPRQHVHVDHTRAARLDCGDAFFDRA